MLFMGRIVLLHLLGSFHSVLSPSGCGSRHGKVNQSSQSRPSWGGGRGPSLLRSLTYQLEGRQMLGRGRPRPPGRTHTARNRAVQKVSFGQALGSWEVLRAPGGQVSGRSLGTDRLIVVRQHLAASCQLFCGLTLVSGLLPGLGFWQDPRSCSEIWFPR